MSVTSAARETIGVVLAAGKGTRMRSRLPKVLHPVAGRPMLHWVLDALAEAGCARLVVIVGHGGEAVRAACTDYDIAWVEQSEQLGTGHALIQAESSVVDDALMLVVSGDVPMVSATTLATLASTAEEGWGAMAVARLEDPGSLGRVLAGDGGELERIVEAADATPEELAVKLVNAGLYALPAAETFARLADVGRDNVKGEIYLTDALGLAAAAGRRIALVELEDAAEAWGINDRAELARVHGEILRRQQVALAAAGVTVLDPARTVIEPGSVESEYPTEIGTGTFIGSDTMLVAPVEVGKDATTAAGSVISKDVPDGALAVERSEQRIIEGWAERRKRKRKKS